MSYQLLKSLHLFGVVLFLGNIVITAAWKAAADQSRNATIIAYAQRLVTITDIVFTAPGAVLILVTGLLMAGSHAAVLETYWLRWGGCAVRALGPGLAAIAAPDSIPAGATGPEIRRGGDSAVLLAAG